MQFPIIFLSVVAAVSAAPQLFFVVPPQFLESKTMQELNSLVPVVVPIVNDQSIAASANYETLSPRSEPVPEVAAEAVASEVSEAPVVASEVVEESLSGAVVQQEAVQESADPQSETEITTDPSPVVEAQEIPAEEIVEPQPSVVDAGQEKPAEEIVEPSVVEPEIVTEAVPQQEEIILPESTLETADIPAEVMTNEIVAEEISKPEETLKSDPSSGKSIQSAVNAIPSTALITHFGYSNPNAIVRSQPNTITYQGTVVDPRTLVPVEFRHFIYQNDSPEVIAAKVAFFRVQAALTPRKKL